MEFGASRDGLGWAVFALVAAAPLAPSDLVSGGRWWWKALAVVVLVGMVHEVVAELRGRVVLEVDRVRARRSLRWRSVPYASITGVGRRGSALRLGFDRPVPPQRIVTPGLDEVEELEQAIRARASHVGVGSASTRP